VSFEYKKGTYNTTNNEEISNPPITLILKLFQKDVLEPRYRGINAPIVVKVVVNIGLRRL
jgi:hypothetical protein